MAIYLSPTLKDELANRVFSYNEECCGNITINPDLTTSFRDERIGETISGHKQCSPVRRQAVFYHTHPITSYAYPSKPDINMMCSHSEYRCSIVATKWGIWQIYRDIGNTHTSDLLILDITTAHGYIEQLFGKLHHYTKQSDHISKEYHLVSGHIMEFIRKMNGTILNHLGVNLSFIDWDTADGLDEGILINLNSLDH